MLKSIKHLQIDEKKPVVLVIHATWCGHCQKLEPIWKELKNSLSNHAQLLDIESENVESELPVLQNQIGLKRKLSVNGYPTIYLIKDGRALSYVGERTYDKLKNWILDGSMKGGRKTKRSKKSMSKTRKNRK